MHDVIMPVTSRHNPIAALSIATLARHINPRHIYVMTSGDNASFFEKLQKHYPVIVLDENHVIPGINLQTIGDYIQKAQQDRNRAGWYFQQFLKMSSCFLPDISDYYLIWDADTIMLNPIEFLNDQNQVLIKPSLEYNKPYFDTYEKLLGRTRSVDFSFISEHCFIKSDYMKELISEIEQHSTVKRHWVWTIMNAMETKHLSHAGFSEYETYGNYVNTVHPEAIALRPLKTIRYAARRFGLVPNRYDIYRLSLSYAYASFESWDTGKAPMIWTEKLLSALIYYTHPGRYLRG